MKNLVRFFVLALVLLMVMPVAAQDELLSASAENCDYGGAFLSMEAVDAHTVKFTLCNPDPAFPSKVAFSALGIHPSEHLTATNGGGPELFQNPVGTGPYALDVS